MIRIQQVKCRVGHTSEELNKKICRTLKIKPDQLVHVRIVKRSLDARKKPDLFFIYTLDCELKNEKPVRKYCDGKNILIPENSSYEIPASGEKKSVNRPVIVGSGPAGLFCAYILSQRGYAPIVIERGKQARERQKAVDEFWKTGMLDTTTNVQFGEGGAGTFSDGKLNTSVKDPNGRNRYVLRSFVKYGADESILYEQKPHIGTDVLIRVIEAMREDMKRMGAEFFFSHQLTDIVIENGRLTGIKINDEQYMDADLLILATGHSARDTFKMLFERKLAMEAKSFAVGIRIEHPQAMINMSQYGREDMKALGAASYKLTHTTRAGRGIYSFCMCPGGYVVNSSSETGLLAVNGMSYHGRDGKNANSAMVVTVSPGDYEAYAGEDVPQPLKGIAFQRALEKKAYDAENGKIPVQLFGDFCENRKSIGPGEVLPCTKGAFSYGNVRQILPDFMNDALIEGITAFGKKIHGFDRADCLLDGLESRTSSPVRIKRDEGFESNIRGIYPCGEGAGYAGGITSAAIDGMRVAEAIITAYAPPGKI